MASISERLKSLGVNLGGGALTQSRKSAKHPIESLIEGQTQDTPFGDAFVVDEFFPRDHLHGETTLRFPQLLDRVAAYAKDSRLTAIDAEGFLFLDTETTGLAGGTGTYAFLVGVGRFEQGGFRQQQFFLRDPIEEPALLSALESFALPASAIVSFNGKSFDWQRGDVMAVPCWRPIVHEIHESAILFSATDEPVQRLCGYLREERSGPVP